MCRPYVCAQTILVCLIENEKGIELKGLEFTETKLRVSRRHKISIHEFQVESDKESIVKRHLNKML